MCFTGMGFAIDERKANTPGLFVKMALCFKDHGVYFAIVYLIANTTPENPPSKWYPVYPNPIIIIISKFR